MNTSRLMPAEWEPHEATWIAWPHEESDWPGKFAAIDWVYAEIVRVLSQSERMDILCHSDAIEKRARHCLDMTHVDPKGYRLHRISYDRSWLRDSLPTMVRTQNGLEWVRWKFSAWAKYDNFSYDQDVGPKISEITKIPIYPAKRINSDVLLVLEGGSIDVDGEGTLLTTEECLLSTIQERNPGLSREHYEEHFGKYLGITKTIWLGRGCVGDDTHGHVDDIARFVAPGKVVLAYENNPNDENHAASADNLSRLQAAVDAKGRKLEIALLPMPHPIWCGEERLPGSYANFYIGNTVVLVPTFNDPNDRVVLEILQNLFPNRSVIGIHAVELVLGQGTLHCLTQQQPKP